MRKKTAAIRYKVPLKRPSESVVLVRRHAARPVVPYDEGLLERARTQWQFGDWQSLARLGRTALQHHPDRAKLALLAAAGRLQIGSVAEAAEFISLAREWGADRRLVVQFLVAGAYNSLGRAAVIAGDVPVALRRFESAINVGAPESDRRLLTKARINQECNELGLPPVPFDRRSVALSAAQSVPRSMERLSVVQTASLNLGEAWAGNTINTVAFRHHGILSHQGKQVTAFYVDERTLRLVQRDLETGFIQNYDLIGQYNLYDAHNSISFGIDRANHLHICYDNHTTQLRYRRGTRPNDIMEWTDELRMTGESEDRVTYPTFIQPHHGFPLTLLYRDGSQNDGTARLKSYDEISDRWHDHPQPVLSGRDSKPWTSNAYWNHPAVGRDGSLHLSFVWRVNSFGDAKLINNVNIGYARSLDYGISWTTSKGQRYQLPITQVNAEIVYPVPPGSNLINQCGMALDSRDRPHIVFYADDLNGIPQYQYLRYDGKQWHHQIVSQRTKPFTLKGRGTLRIPISRPEILVDFEDNVYLITRGDHSRGRMVATMLAAPDYVWSESNTKVLWDEDLGFAEPVIDRVRWEQDNVLTLLIQYNEQPDHDMGCRPQSGRVTLLDVKFVKESGQ